MRYLLNKTKEFLSRLKLRNQLNILYTLGFFIPMVCIGLFLIFNTSKLLTNYYKDLNASNNQRAKNVLFEITNQIYTFSEDIAFDKDLHTLLTGKYENIKDFILKANNYREIEDYLESNSALYEVAVYSDNESLYDYNYFKKVDEATKASHWYQKASKQLSAFWISSKIPDKYGNVFHNLTLIRKVPLPESGKFAVLTIKIDENFLRGRLDTTDYELLLYVDDGGIFFSTYRQWYDLSDEFYIDYEDSYYSYEGQMFINDQKYMVSVSTLKLYQADNRIYVYNLDNSAYDNINQILSLCLLIVAAATLLPLLLIRFFILFFSGRVNTLREAMHSASTEKYDFQSKLMGEDEISQAFADLQKMIEKIKVKDAKMYEARLNSQRLQNAQQRIEMEMLASQINPHFLYNTLETIRMKAYKAGDKDVATAIKLLGKSMRYVLENTGTSSTTLKNELDYIETYLQIQRLRFSDRVNYTLEIEEGLKAEDHDILPLLIQPAIENAIIHGLEDSDGNGQIWIKVYTEAENLHIDILDNGCGMAPETLQALRNKIESPHLNPNKNIGLYNINQRIHLCYGPQYGIFVDSILGEGTKVSLTLPLKINLEVL